VAARLHDVKVSTDEQGVTVRLKTSGSPTYRTELIDSPARIVIDLADTTYSWRKSALPVSTAPITQIRGSQYRKGVARIVVQLTGPVEYSIRQDGEELDLVLPKGTLPAATPATDPGTETVAATPTAQHPAALPGEAADAAPAGTRSGDTPVRAAFQVVQATPRAQAPAPTPPPPANGGRLISLDFKDADVVNLLRILAAESAKNIVIGEDVKGKMSISLRNVPWERALDTILEAKGLQRIERDGLIRIVSDEQLAKEREARARVEEAKVKAEVDIRTKMAEAQFKEAEAQQKKLAAEAARLEAEARGPLKEETIRLSYADPEEVAKTLQGILGIPAEGQKIQGAGLISGPLIAEPPFAQLYGQQLSQPPPPGPVISVSQNVLDKGLTIRAHKPTNTLFLRLYAADLERIKALIRDSLDIPLPQVKIEARMEILDRNALEQIGIQWGGLGAATTNNTTLVGQGFQSTLQGGQTVPFTPGRVEGPTTVIDPTGVVGLSSHNQNFLLQSVSSSAVGGLPVSFLTGLPLGGNLVNLPLQTLPNAGPLPAGGISFGIIGTRLNINLALQALSEQGKTRTLARPEIVTVENNRATMSLGEEIPYATISSAGTQIAFKEALLKLEVTPTVIREGEIAKIKMIVIVENNSRGTVVNLGSAGQPPAINKRKAETQVLIKEGDRLVIGGVSTGVNQNTVRKVPLLGDMPILGHLFRIKENFETGRELVVFLTPSVLRTPATAIAPPTSPPTR
jgi:type IV pilus assembly protein PilQ